MQTSQKSIFDIIEEVSTSSAEASLVNPTQAQASDLEKKMTDTSGLRCLEQFEKFNHVGSWAKTFSALLIGMKGWYSMRCRLTWKLKGTKSNRLYFQLVQSTLHTSDKESGLLLTPTSVMTDEPPEKMRERAEKNGYKNGTQYGSLLSQVKYSGILPTPLTQYMNQNPLLNTPTASDKNGGCTRSNPKLQLGTSLVNEMHGVLNRPTGKTSQLNPQFVAEMMGFPTNWTELPFLNGETNQ
jgi:hypothetical protein